MRSAVNDALEAEWLGQALAPQVVGDPCQEASGVLVEHGCLAELGEPRAVDGHVLGVADREFPVDELHSDERLLAVFPVLVDGEPMRSRRRRFGVLRYEAERDVPERTYGAHPVQLREQQLR